MEKIKLNSFVTLICIACCLILMTACSSTDSAPDDDAAVTATITTGSGDPFYFVHDIDEGLTGIRANYSVDDEGNETYELSTNWVEFTPANHIALVLNVPGEGTYQGAETGDDYGVFILTYIANEFEDTEKYYTADKATVTITEVSENRVKGTFSGTLSSKDGERVVIEDGKFDVIPKYTIID